jgi:hypothetical protein
MEAAGEFAAEFQHPLADRLVCHGYAASCQDLFDHSQTQREVEIQPNSIADEFGGVAIASIERVSERHRPGQISVGLASAKPKARST